MILALSWLLAILLLVVGVLAGMSLQAALNRSARKAEREKLRRIYETLDLKKHHDGQRGTRPSPQARPRIRKADMSSAQPPRKEKIS